MQFSAKIVNILLIFNIAFFCGVVESNEVLSEQEVDIPEENHDDLSQINIPEKNEQNQQRNSQVNNNPKNKEQIQQFHPKVNIPQNYEENQKLPLQINIKEDFERNMNNGQDFAKSIKDMIPDLPQPLGMDLLRSKRSSCLLGGNVLCTKNCRSKSFNGGECSESFSCICI